MSLMPNLLNSCSLRTKLPRILNRRRAKEGHRKTKWEAVSSSSKHLLHRLLVVSPMFWRCLLKLKCPVRTPTKVRRWQTYSYKNNSTKLMLILFLKPKLIYLSFSTFFWFNLIMNNELSLLFFIPFLNCLTLNYKNISNSHHLWSSHPLCPQL